MSDIPVGPFPDPGPVPPSPDPNVGNPANNEVCATCGSLLEAPLVADVPATPDTPPPVDPPSQQ
jgi:hypothetical protein